jgi:hypothetical protein
MSHYTPTSFIRRCGAAALQSLLAHEQTSLPGVDWALGPKLLADAVVSAVSNLPEAQQERLSVTWLEIHRMANDHGVRCLIDEATTIPAFAQDAVFQGLASDHARVVHMWCHYHRIWQTSKRLAATEELSNTRYWHERTNAPAKAPIHDEATCTALGEAVSQVFAKQLRGQHYRFDAHPCTDGCFYFGVLRDLPVTDEVFNEAGDDLVPMVRERVFEVVIWCPSEGGRLACHIAGGSDRSLRERIFEAFSIAVFKEALQPLLPKHPMENRWKLDHLINKGTLPADPASGAIHGRVLALTLTALGRGNEKLTVEADLAKGPDAMQAAIKAWVNAHNIPWMTIRVVWAKLCLEWPIQGRRRRTLTWEVSLPGRNTLQSQREDRRRIGDQHLILWGIDVQRPDQRSHRPRTAA